MSDITMCKDEKCPHRKLCYRFTAEPDEVAQAYFRESPRLWDDSCDYFWEKL